MTKPIFYVLTMAMMLTGCVSGPSAMEQSTTKMTPLPTTGAVAETSLVNYEEPVAELVQRMALA